MKRTLLTGSIPRLLPLALLLAAGCGREQPAHLGKTLDEWRSQIDSPERLDRLSAIRAVGDMARLGLQAPEATGVLVQSADHDDSAVRYWAVASIGNLETPGESALGRVAQALADEAPEVRVAAAGALCKHGQTAEGLPVLVQELRNPNGPTRLAAAHAIEALGEGARPAVDALRERLDDEFGYPGRVAERILRNLGALPAE